MLEVVVLPVLSANFTLFLQSISRNHTLKLRRKCLPRKTSKLRRRVTVKMLRMSRVISKIRKAWQKSKTLTREKSLT